MDFRNYELRLRQLELEILKQRERIEQIDSHVGRQDDSLSALKAHVTIMVATWHSEIGIGLDRLSRQLDRTNIEDDHWRVLRDHVERAQGDFSRHIKNSSPSLTELETKICLLLGMDLTVEEIANTLNVSAVAIADIFRDIRGKFDRSAEHK